MLLLLELALQVVVPMVFRPRFSRVDRELGWAHNASVSHAEQTEGHSFELSYNSHGFRPPERTYEKPQGVKRVLVLGDSYVDGSEVGDREIFTWHLEQCLPGVEVLNLGVYGYTTAQELLLLEREGLRYDPDLVLLVTITNDYIGNVLALESFGPAPRFLLDGDGLRFEGTRHPAAQRAFLGANLPAPRFVHEHSLVYYLLNHYFYQPRIAEQIERVRDERAAVHDEEERLTLYQRLVRRIADRAEATGADFWVVFSYMEPELVENAKSPHAAARDRVRGDQIHTLDLLPALRSRQASGDASLYFDEDIHWNPVGHAFIADLLAGEIQSWLAGQDPAETPADPVRCVAGDAARTQE